MKFRGCSLDNFSATSADLTPILAGSLVGWILLMSDLRNSQKKPIQKNEAAKNLYQTLGTFDTVGRNPAPLDVWGWALYMGVSENSGTPKSSILKNGFPLFSPSHFWGFPPIFGSTPLYILSVVIIGRISEASVSPLTWPWGCSGQWYPSGWTRACSGERHWGSTQPCCEATWM